MNPAMLALLAARVASAGDGLAATYLGSATSTAAQPTFPGMALGTPATGRTIIIGLTTRTVTAGAVFSITVGGVAATQDLFQANGWQRVVFARAVVPSGTTGDVVITSSHDLHSHGTVVSLWSLPRAVSVHTSGSSVGSGVAIPLNVAAGALLGLAGSAVTSGHVWSGVTEAYDISAGTTKASGGSAAVPAGGVTVSATFAGGPLDTLTAAINYV